MNLEPFLVYLNTIPETNSSHPARKPSKKETILPTIHFRMLFVSFRELISSPKIPDSSFASARCTSNFRSSFFLSIRTLTCPDSTRRSIHYSSPDKVWDAVWKWLLLGIWKLILNDDDDDDDDDEEEFRIILGTTANPCKKYQKLLTCWVHP